MRRDNGRQMEGHERVEYMRHRPDAFQAVSVGLRRAYQRTPDDPGFADLLTRLDGVLR